MKKELTDKEHAQLLEDFANDHSLAIGGNIQVTKTEHSEGYAPREGYGGFKFEDGHLLSSILQGATHFLYYLRRNGYEIRKQKLPNKKVNP